MKQKQFYNSTAWKYFSRYVLTYYANKEGIVKCSTCGAYKDVTDKLMQCGHYIKSNNRSTSLDFENCAPQCYRCNKHFSGKPDIMRSWLIEKHGQEKIDKLEIKQHNQVPSFGKFEMNLFRLEWKPKYKELADEKGYHWK